MLQDNGPVQVAQGEREQASLRSGDGGLISYLAHRQRASICNTVCPSVASSTKLARE